MDRRLRTLPTWLESPVVAVVPWSQGALRLTLFLLYQTCFTDTRMRVAKESRGPGWGWRATQCRFHRFRKSCVAKNLRLRALNGDMRLHDACDEILRFVG